MLGRDESWGVRGRVRGRNAGKSGGGALCALLLLQILDVGLDVLVVDAARLLLSHHPLEQPLDHPDREGVERGEELDQQLVARREVLVRAHRRRADLGGHRRVRERLGVGGDERLVAARRGVGDLDPQLLLVEERRHQVLDVLRHARRRLGDVADQVLRQVGELALEAVALPQHVVQVLEARGLVERLEHDEGGERLREVLDLLDLARRLGEERHPRDDAHQQRVRLPLRALARAVAVARLVRERVRHLPRIGVHLRHA